MVGQGRCRNINKFANHQKIVNIIWQMPKHDGSLASSFEDTVQLGGDSFKNIYKEES